MFIICSSCGTMNILLRFQKFVTVALVTDWLTAKDFVDLDSAFCNKQDRKILHSYIESFPHPFGKLLTDSLVIPLSVEIYQWAESRKFDVSYLNRAVINGKFTEKLGWLSFFSTPKIKAYAPCLKSLQVTESGLDHLKQTLPYVTLLEALEYRGTKNPGITDLLIKCSNLLKLNFNHCIELQEPDVVNIIHHCPQLNSLYLLGCKHMNKSLAKALIVRGRNVTRLDLRKCYQINKRWVRMMVFLMCQLVEFARDYMSDLSIRQLVWYRGRELERLTCVKSLKLANGDADILTDETLAQLARACHSLRELCVSECTSLTNRGIEQLTTQGSSCAATLRVVDLQLLPLLSGGALRSLTEGCPQLREISLRSQPNIKEEGLRSIGTNCKELRRLTLVDMKGLTGEILLYVVSECRKLESLNVSQCTGITDREAALCMPHLVQLTSLNLAQCKLLSDVTLVEVGRHCLYLQEVCIDQCVLVTIRGVAAVMGNAKHLRRMSFHGIPLTPWWYARNEFTSGGSRW